MQQDIHIAQLEDWEAVYVDGKLIYEDHRIDAYTMAGLLGFTPTIKWHDKWDIDEYLPETLEELNAAG